ncbi:MAG: hypothetical protein NC221_03505 [Duncaniella sp.]|nr:hypothetical protein [Muribaculum sp.]MCM1255168.1 hypothetical protein [Duncaniella sp.]
MNDKSPLYRALESRGEGRKLPLDFSSQMMTEIRAIDKRRRRAEIIWSVIGYLIAVVAAGGALFYYCRGILGDVAKGLIASGADFAEGTSSDISVFDNILQVGVAMDGSYMTIATILSAAAALLLALDYLMRRKFAVKYDENPRA